MLQEKINFNEAKNKSFEFIRRNGPSMPSQVAKEISIPPLFASALLSQLITEKSLKVSNLKVGGSPLYYVEDQKEKLLEFTNNLPTVEKNACDKLKSVGVVADEGLKLAEKVALRNIKDFSIPLNVNIRGVKKLFWKWHLLPQEGAIERIEKIVKLNTELQKPIEEPKTEIKEEKRTITEEKEEIEEKVEKEIEEPKKIVKVQDFSEDIKKFLSSNKVKVLEENEIRKNREMELVLQLNSSLGKISFFAIAKNKKVITPADVTLVHYRGQEKKLPLIFLSSGKFTKKAEEKAAELGITLKTLEEKI